MFGPTPLRTLSRALLLATLALLAVTSVASADRSFSVRYATNDTGDVAGIANTLMTCPAGSSSNPGGIPCASAQGAAPTATSNNAYNNNYDMTYVDGDSDATTFNSSSATQSLPAGSQVLFAGLYWGGDWSTGTAAAPDAGARNQVRLRVPGSSSYTTLTADTVDDSTLNVGRYQAFKDVTGTVRGLANAGNGTYTVANVQAGRGGDHYAGWTLIVAYRDTTQPARNLTVFDGLRTIRASDAPTDIPVSGFLTPPAGQVKTEIGFVTWEGDHGIVGDTASLNGNVLGDAQHPSTNFFNSRISRDGVLSTDRSPAYANAMGFDVAFTNADGFIGNSATSATVRVTTSGDQYLPGVITFATEIYAPKIEQTKTVVDENGGEVEQGDVLTYTIANVNSGQDGATGFVVRDPIPASTSYVPGSIVLGGTSTVAGGVTDGAGDDRGEYDVAGRRVVARVGAGASTTSGGTVAPTRTATVSFKVRVNGPAAADDPVPAGTVITNTATAAFSSQTTNTPLTATSSVSRTVRSPDLRIRKSRTGAALAAGGSSQYTLAVDNAGDAPSQGQVTVGDDLPAGITATAIDAPGWTCPTVPTTAVTCTRSDALAAGAAYPPLVLEVAVGQGVSGSVANSATVSGGGDAQPGNNSSTDTSPVAVRSADLSLVKRADPGQATPGGTLDYFLVTTNNGPDAADGVTVTDVLPAGVSFVSGAPGCNEAPAGTVTCTYGQPILAGTSRQTGFTVRVAASATGTIRNTATVRSALADPDPSNNAGTVDTPVLANADVAVRKTVDRTAPAAGDTVTYTLKATNDGPATARDVVLKDTLPPGVTFASADAPCTQKSGVVRCELGALEPGGAVSKRIRATVDPIAVAPAGADHQLDVQKVEAQMDLDAGQQRTVSVSCPSGFLVTDGSARIDAVDQGTGTLASPRVVESRADGRDRWTATVRNDASGRAQGKVFAVCVSERTSLEDGHRHELVTGDPVTVTRTLTAGRNDVTLECGTGRTPIQPGHRLEGDATLLTSMPQGDSSWTFAVDATAGASGTFSVRCLADTVSSAGGHTHPLTLKLLRKDVVVGAGQVAEVQLDCSDDAKGVVGGFDVDPGLVPLGNDPRPKTRAYRFFNPTGQSLNASVSLLCLSTRVGGARATNTIDNTAYVSTSSPETDVADNESTVRITAASSRRGSVASRSIRVRGTTATATIRCAAGRTRCRGPVRLVASTRQKLGGKVVRKGALLASATYSVAPGKTATVKLRSSATGRKALRSTSLRRAQLRLGSASRTVTVRR